VATLGGLGSNIDQLQAPNGLALTPDGGELLIADQRNDRIAVWSLGTTETAPISVSSVDPASYGQGAANKVLTISGSGFAAGAGVAVSGAGVTVPVSSVVVHDDTTITATVSVTAGAAIGARNVTVTNADGGSAVCTGCFSVVGKPTLAVSPPASAPQGATNATLVLTGTNLRPGLTLAFGSGVGIKVAPVVQGDTVTVGVSVGGSAALGNRNIVVTNPDGSKSTCTSCFVVAPKPTVTSATPDSANRGTQLTVLVEGSGLQADATVTFGNNVVVSNVQRLSGTELQVDLTIPASAAKGFRTIAVTNPDGSRATLSSGFKVT
jgi:hypothetical protein